jgi:N-acetylmuramoyl-L-alanine amidase
MFQPKSYLIFALLALVIAGCATVPSGPSAAVTPYNLNGSVYYSLMQLCSLHDISWDYDPVCRTVILNKSGHNISLMAGDKLALVDGRALHLSLPVDISGGKLMVPAQFKSEVIDALFRAEALPKPGYTALFKLRKVVIDAGHGGKDPGAVGRSGLREKDVNLDIARKLGELLKAQGVQVVFTRSNDRFIPLPVRAQIANSAQADVFISIHSNANRTRSLNGFEIYYIRPQIDDARRAMNTARSVAPPVGGASLASRSPAVKAILWDLAYTFDRGESFEMARAICRSMGGKTDARIIGVKGANFEVLRGARMPAVLIETGFLSNAQEERMLKSASYRQKVAEAVIEGLDDYARSAPLLEARR